jgi:hypothetical protein
MLGRRGSCSLWLAGNLSRINNQPCGNLVQISTNGQVVLNPFGATLNDFVEGICKSPDGYYFVWGRFTSYQGNPAPRILKINSLGQRDVSFAVGSGFDNVVSDVVPRNNGDVFVRGLFATYKTASLPNGLAVLDAQGNLQAAKSQTITSGTGFYKATDQSILITGNFLSNGDFQILKKLKPDFTWDTTFRAPAPPTSGILKIIVQPDGIIVGTTNARQNNVFRLLPNGRTDTTFQSFPGPDHDATDFVLDADNKIILAGKFDEIHVVAVPRLARLFNDLNTTALPKTTLLKENQLYPNPAHDYVGIAGIAQVQHAKATNAQGQTIDLKVSAGNTISVDVLKPGCYVLTCSGRRKNHFL